MLSIEVFYFAKLYIEELQNELKRFKNGIEFVISESQDDETWDYLINLLAGTEEKAMYNRFKK